MVSRRTVSRRILRNPFRIFFGIYMEPHNEVARMSIRCNKYCMYWCTSTCIFYYMKCVNIYLYIYIHIWSVELGSIQRLGSILRYWIRLYIPHIFVWGSCFLLCTPVGLPPPPPSLCHTQLFHHNSSTRNSSTHNSFTHNFVTHSFVTHTTLSRTTLSHATLSHTALPQAELPAQQCLPERQQLLEHLRCEIKVPTTNLSTPMSRAGRWKPLTICFAGDKGDNETWYAPGELLK
jgi:hypothetical protein